MKIRIPLAPVVFFIAGCGPAQFITQLPDHFVINTGQTIEYVPIENVTGKNLDLPSDEIFNEYMTEMLGERKLLSISSKPAAYVLKTELTEYSAGNALGRWLAPGIGTTVCAVNAELRDKRTGMLIGRMRSRQTVSAGGFYSIGADHYICQRAADDLIREIDGKINFEKGSKKAEIQ